MSLISSAFADVTHTTCKLKSGVKDILGAPQLIVDTTSEQLKRTKGDGILHGQPLGFASGILEGTASMVAQMVKGVVKIITFPVN